MGFSVAHILSPSIGMQVAGHFGFRALWFLTSGIAVMAALGFWLIWKKAYK
jgi:predicted MFS family arabinose efflux permease